eukprot:scaffold1959_cov243-Pinguiococcus_pyrenoidosus.AAC.3
MSTATASPELSLTKGLTPHDKKDFFPSFPSGKARDSSLSFSLSLSPSCDQTVRNVAQDRLPQPFCHLRDTRDTLNSPTKNPKPKTRRSRIEDGPYRSLSSSITSVRLKLGLWRLWHRRIALVRPPRGVEAFQAPQVGLRGGQDAHDLGAAQCRGVLQLHRAAGAEHPGGGADHAFSRRPTCGPHAAFARASQSAEARQHRPRHADLRHRRGPARGLQLERQAAVRVRGGGVRHTDQPAQPGVHMGQDHRARGGRGHQAGQPVRQVCADRPGGRAAREGRHP